MAQRRIDLILESVRRLLRMGATPNLLNLLQKQHPADLAQIFSELPEKERHATFNILVDKAPKLAMEAISEIGPEKGAELLALRSAEEIARLTHAPPPKFVEPDADAPPTRGSASKRISNRRMLAELLPSLHYPSYREGLAAAFLQA